MLQDRLTAKEEYNIVIVTMTHSNLFIFPRESLRMRDLRDLRWQSQRISSVQLFLAVGGWGIFSDARAHVTCCAVKTRSVKYYYLRVWGIYLTCHCAPESNPLRVLGAGWSTRCMRPEQSLRFVSTAGLFVSRILPVNRCFFILVFFCMPNVACADHFKNDPRGLRSQFENYRRERSVLRKVP